MKLSPLTDASGKPLIKPKEAAFGCWGFAVCILLLAIKEWENPSVPPFTGRSSWLYYFFTALFGSKGPLFFYLGFAAFLFSVGVLAWRNANKAAR
jgi:hypothetical protein